MLTARILFRQLAASPSFAVVSVVTLAVGIGANLAIFTVVNAVLLRPLPLPDSDRIVVLEHVAPGLTQLDSLPMSDALYVLYANESRTLAEVALFEGTQLSFTGSANPQRVPAVRVSASFFDVVRTPPQLGRTLRRDDERPESPPVVVLTDGLWRTRFGGASNTIGQVVEIDGIPAEVVGVMPPGFTFPDPDTQLWQPIQLNPERVDLGSFGWAGLARIADGQTLEQVQVELTSMATNLVELFPGQGAAALLANAGFAPDVKLARDMVVGDVEATLWILLGSVGFLLLIACANVANLIPGQGRGTSPRAGDPDRPGRAQAWRGGHDDRGESRARAGGWLGRRPAGVLGGPPAGAVRTSGVAASG